MDPFVAVWMVNVLLAGAAVIGWFQLAILYAINADAFVSACRKLLAEGAHERFEKLLRAVPERVPLTQLVGVGWSKRREPAPVPMLFGSYREAPAPPSYAERMKTTLAPYVKIARRRVLLAHLLTIPGLSAPVATWLLIGLPPPWAGPWIVAIVIALVAIAAWHSARRITGAFEPALDALLPLFEPASRDPS